MRRKPIYILGGMGPDASRELYRALIKKAQTVYGASQNKDYPEIVLHSIPVPDFISDESSKLEALEYIKEVVTSINPQRFGMFAIACSTAHLLAEELTSLTDVEFVSMIKAVGDLTKGLGYRRVGVLEVRTTLKARIFHAVLDQRSMEVLTPSVHDQASLEKGIRNVLAGRLTGADVHTVLRSAGQLEESGAEACILGCTELPLLFSERALTTNGLISSIDALANALLEKYYA